MTRKRRAGGSGGRERRWWVGRGGIEWDISRESRQVSVVGRGDNRREG